jgi:hypothetical protein
MTLSGSRYGDPPAATDRCPQLVIWFPPKQEPDPSKGQSNPRSAKLKKPVPVTIT